MTNNNEYGKALFTLSEEAGRTENILSEMKTVFSLLSDNPDYIKLLDTPALKKAERLMLIDEAFGGFDEYLINLIKILCEKRCVHSFPDVYRTFISLYESSRGILHVEAVSAVKLSEAQSKRLIKRISDMTGATIILSNTVDPDILGGIKLRYGNTQLDGSVKTQLDGLAKSLKASILQ